MKERPIQTLVTLTAVGDIMLGDGPVTVGHGVGSTIKKNGVVPVFKDVESIIKKGDIAFGNLESVVSNKDMDINNMKSSFLRAHPDTIEGLNFAGFNVLSLANNHSRQYGEDGIKDTIDNLSKYHIRYIGVGSSFEEARIPLHLTIKGIKIAFLAYCLVPDKTAYISITSPEEIYSDTKKTKVAADFVIVSLHWGNEFIEIPSPDQIRFAHRIIDSGASLILGHHPHILQGIEQYHNGLIAYSLGNFIFDLNYLGELRSSVILECQFSKSGIVSYKQHPVYIEKHYNPIMLKGNEETKALQKLERLSLILKKAAEGNMQEYENKVAKRRRSVKRRMIFYFIRNIYRYEWQYTWSNIIKYFKKKLK